MIERMVLFGASGDLTSRLLLPAVAQLAEAELLPPALTMVVSMLSFQPADVTEPEDVSRVIGDDHLDTLVYLALPPSLLTKVLPALATTTLGSADAVAIEKPFGTDLGTAPPAPDAQHLSSAGPRHP